jgi:hypothetical protein
VASVWTLLTPRSRYCVVRAFLPGTSRGYLHPKRGRDYAGVTPVRGIYQGGDGRSADVSVEVTRLR